MQTYTFRIILEPDEHGAFHGYVPALRGCHAWGETLQEARKKIKDAIRAYIASLIADKQPIPQENGFEMFETISQEELLPAVKAYA